jgi:hypothetical protein
MGLSINAGSAAVAAPAAGWSAAAFCAGPGLACGRHGPGPCPEYESYEAGDALAPRLGCEH